MAVDASNSTDPEFVPLVCRKCGRRIALERAHVTFAPDPAHGSRLIASGPGWDNRPGEGNRELCCPYHDGNIYWLEPVDSVAELRRVHQARLARRLLDDITEPKTCSVVDGALADRIDMVEIDSEASLEIFARCGEW